jgi:hypothetical protein
MATCSWLRNLFASRAPRTIRPPRRLRPVLEILEDRRLLSGLSAGQVAAAYGQLPLSFEANQGQSAAQVSFLAQGPQSTLFLTTGGNAVLTLNPQGTQPGDVLEMQLQGANASPTVSGQDLLPGVSNYLVGNDPSQWHTNIPNYAEVDYHGVYAGIDLHYYGNSQHLEYDFVVAPGANPGTIRLSFAGQQGMSLDAQGNLVLQTAAGTVVEQAPVLYQVNSDGTHTAVLGAYVLEGDGTVGLQVGAYDHSRALVIDPVLAYSTYLGGSGDDLGQAIAVDGNGNAYVTGSTNSTDFPTTAGAFQTTEGGIANAFVAKLNAAGTALVYSTYLGGNVGDEGLGIAVDGSGNAYVTGSTTSKNFPTTPGAFQTTYGSGQDAFVAKLNAAGSALVYSTYLGSSGNDQGLGIAVDGSGNAYVTGYTLSSNFPTTAGAFQTTYGSGQDAFVTKLNASGSALVYSTYLGGSGADQGNGIAVDGSGNAYVTGSTNSTGFPTTAGAFQTTYGGGADAFVTKLNAAGSALVYSTYLGGSGGDAGNGIAVDGSGNAYVTGSTTAKDFPTTPGAFQTTKGGIGNAFVTKLNAAGTALAYSTYLGGNVGDRGTGIAVDGSGDAYVTGWTYSSNFPTTAGAFQTSLGGSGVQNAFVTKLNGSGSALVYSTYLGGSGNDVGNGITVDGSGNAYVIGYANSTNFPTTPGAFQTTPGAQQNAFVTKFEFSPPPPASPAPSPVPPVSGPRILSVSPIVKGALRRTLTVLGLGFTPGSVLLVNGRPVATWFVDGTHLEVPRILRQVQRLLRQRRPHGRVAVFEEGLLTLQVLVPGVGVTPAVPLEVH